MYATIQSLSENENSDKHGCKMYLQAYRQRYIWACYIYMYRKFRNIHVGCVADKPHHAKISKKCTRLKFIAQLITTEITVTTSIIWQFRPMLQSAMDLQKMTNRNANLGQSGLLSE